MQVAGNSGWKHHLERGGRGPDARGLVVSVLFFLGVNYGWLLFMEPPHSPDES